jgi:hypothetical protein
MSRVRDLASILTASSSMATDVEVTTAVSNHSAASDPHPGYVLESLIDAKGDLIVGSADNTVAKLSTGNSGESIVADSSTSTGLRYQGSMAAGKNAVINGAMDIWQRGTANVTGSAAYTADRWQKGTATHYGVSRQLTGDTTNLPFIQYCARVQRTAGSSTTNGTEFAQSFETINSIPFVGKTVTVSYYARKGADFSSTNSLMSVSLLYGTGTDQAVYGTYTGAAYVINQAQAALTSTWQRFTATGTVPATATELAIAFGTGPTGTAGANDYYEVTGVQLELGSVATAFARNSGTIQGELAACQRYYYRKTGTQPLGMGYAQSTTVTRTFLSHPMQMRTAPTMATNSGTNFFYFALGGTDTNGSSLTFETASVTGVTASLTLTSGTPTTGYPGRLQLDNASAYLEGSAEL